MGGGRGGRGGGGGDSPLLGERFLSIFTSSLMFISYIIKPTVISYDLIIQIILTNIQDDRICIDMSYVSMSYKHVSYILLCVRVYVRTFQVKGLFFLRPMRGGYQINTSLVQLLHINFLICLLWSKVYYDDKISKASFIFFH